MLHADRVSVIHIRGRSRSEVVLKDMTTFVQKIEASERQLNEAVLMWLDVRDPLSLHTVVMAGFGILKDLHYARFPDQESDPLRGMLSKLGYREFNRIANFLKHADRDPDASISVPNDKLNESRIGMCIPVLRCLDRNLSSTLGAFHLMSMMTYPEKFQIAPDQDEDVERGAHYFAHAAQESTDLRRQAVHGYIKMMEAGLIPADINLRRSYGDAQSPNEPPLDLPNPLKAD